MAKLVRSCGSRLLAGLLLHLSKQLLLLATSSNYQVPTAATAIRTREIAREKQLYSMNRSATWATYTFKSALINKFQSTPVEKTLRFENTKRKKRKNRKPLPHLPSLKAFPPVDPAPLVSSPSIGLAIPGIWTGPQEWAGDRWCMADVFCDSNPLRSIVTVPRASRLTRTKGGFQHEVHSKTFQAIRTPG